MGEIMAYGLRFCSFGLKTMAVAAALALAIGAAPRDAGAVSQIQTKYYTIVYEENGEYIAGEIAKFCDEIYEQLLARYHAFNSDPRVTCIVTDEADYANGFAQYFQNTITIYATSMDFELRGQSNWLRNVFVHEMTHMIALKKAVRGPINFAVLGVSKYDKNPDFDATLVLSHLSQPQWFSEGSAQLGAETYGAERWDTHRDMLLRTAWLDDALLPFEEMESLSGKKGMESEMVYNQGYSLLRYIRDTYGYDKVVKLNNVTTLMDFNPTIERVLGVAPKKLYADWRASLDSRYAGFRNRSFAEGDKAADKGSTDYRPAVSPDGRWLAWISNRGRDYAITDLVLEDLATGKTRVVAPYVEYRPSWSHDSGKLVYSRRPSPGSRFYDIFTYDIASCEEERVSKNMRARDPSFSPGDSLIVFVRNDGGNNTIAVIQSNGAALRYLTSTHDGTQFYTPSYSPDGSRILFCMFRQNLDRDIAVLENRAHSWRYRWDLADTTKGFSDSTSFAGDAVFRLLLGSKADERDPEFLPGGEGIVFASDRTGVFNLYTLDIAGGKARRITDVSGGAFCPSPGPNGTLYYAGYHSRDYSIYKMKSMESIEEVAPEKESREYLVQPKPFSLDKNFSVQPYSTKRVLNAIVPTVMVGPSFIGSRFGLNVVDVGAQAYFSDVLGQDAFAMSGSVGKNLKEDVALNSRLDVYYERRMAPITSSRRTHAPSLYAGASRAVINNYIARFEGMADTLFYGNVAGTDFQNVLQDISSLYTVADLYRDEFRQYRTGIQLPLAPRHFLTVETSLRQYFETLKRSEKLRDFSSFVLDGTDITDQIPGAGSTRTADTRFFSDMEYFRSAELSLSYLYMHRIPTADDGISPKGTTALVQFSHMRTDVTDSLVNQPKYLVPTQIGFDGEGNLVFNYGTYNPDDQLDALRPQKRRVDLNEYLIVGNGNYRLPRIGHDFGAFVLVGYRDTRLKDTQKGEGNGYNWPLKYYLGGEYSLAGYPYFSFWGSKVFLSRFTYTFPIRNALKTDMGGVLFQRLYGSAFFEAGSTWNFNKLSMDRIREGSIKRDIGIELRMQTVLFYRFDALAYAKLVWALDGMGGSPYKNDARRWYFGFRM
jgi:Tol biopolymer transport system component